MSYLLDNILLKSLIDLDLHRSHSLNTGEDPSTVTTNSCPNPKCSKIQFTYNIILMIHELPTLENEYPRVTEMFSKMIRPGMPKYGLGYHERLDSLIPSSRFQNPIPPEYK